MRVVIIGGGISGTTAGFTIRNLDQCADITMISSENLPVYSPCILADYLSGKVERENVFLKREEGYEEANIRRIWNTEVKKVDLQNRKVIVGEELPYDKLVIATGASPIKLNVKGIDKQGVYFFKNMVDADCVLHHLGSQVVIIGAGAIGVEVAIALRKLDRRVYLIDVMDWILSAMFDEKPARIVENMLRARGIKILTSRRATEIMGKRQVEGLRTETETIECDHVIVCTGNKPNLEFVAGERLAVGETGGLLVDEKMRTNIEDVYACGDCVETLDRITGQYRLSALWPDARKQGRVAGYNCMGIPKKYPGLLRMNNLNIFGISALSVGLTSKELSNLGEVKVVEKERGEEYIRILTVDGIICGGQFVSDNGKAGLISSAIYSALNLEGIYEVAHDRGLSKANPICSIIAYHVC